VLAALGLIDAQLCSLCGSLPLWATIPPSTSSPAWLRSRNPATATNTETNNELLPEEDFELIYER
jgi:hypothetical protein